VTTARALLEAVADGAPDAIERARELADADIEARGGGLALQVLSGDAFAVARAVELARIVLERARTASRLDHARGEFRPDRRQWGLAMSAALRSRGAPRDERELEYRDAHSAWDALKLVNGDGTPSHVR
jgi:hypothetical protein